VVVILIITNLTQVILFVVCFWNEEVIQSFATVLLDSSRHFLLKSLGSLLSVELNDLLIKFVLMGFVHTFNLIMVHFLHISELILGLLTVFYSLQSCSGC